MTALTDALTDYAAQTTARISPAEVAGRVYWVKKPERLSGVRRLQKGDGQRAFEAERAAYHHLSKLGLPVPGIAAEGPDFFALPDCGLPTSRLLQEEMGSEADRLVAFEAVARGLWAFHGKGVSHGRPSLKDILWDGRRVFFIDFERFCQQRNNPRGHAEDLAMLVFNALAVAQKHRPEIDAMIATYRQLAPDTIWTEAQTRVRRWRWLNWATKPIQMRGPGKAKEFKAIPLTLQAFA